MSRREVALLGLSLTLIASGGALLATGAEAVGLALIVVGLVLLLFVAPSALPFG